MADEIEEMKENLVPNFTKWIETADDNEKEVISKFVGGLAQALAGIEKEDAPKQHAAPISQVFAPSVTPDIAPEIRPLTGTGLEPAKTPLWPDENERLITTAHVEAKAREKLSSRALGDLGIEKPPTQGLPSRQATPCVAVKEERPLTAAEKEQKSLQEYIDRALTGSRKGSRMGSRAASRPGTRSVLEDKYRPSTRDRQQETMEKLKSREKSREPKKFEDTLRPLEAKEEGAEDCIESNFLKKKLIASLMNQMTDVELEKLEEIIRSDGLKPVGAPSNKRDVLNLTTGTRIVPMSLANETINAGAGFQCVDTMDPGHFVIHPQFTAERTEPTNIDYATINDLV